MSSVRGIFLKILALALFTIMAAMAKAAMDTVPTGQAVFFRAFCSFPVILGWLLWQGDLVAKLRTRNPGLHVLRGVVGGTAMGLNFAALSLLPLPEVTVIGFVSPFFTLVLAVLMLGETVRAFRWSMVALGLVGVSIVIWPRLTLDAETASIAAMIGVFCVLCAALLRSLVQIHIRKMVKTEHPSAIVFYFTATVSIFALLTAPFGWVWPSANVLFLLIGSGLVGGVAQLMVTQSLKLSDASVLAPFEYASILFAMTVGYLWFADIPTGPMLMGASLVVVSGMLIIWRERQIGIKARQDRVSVTPQG